MYATGSPFMLTANVYWKRFLNVLRPAYTPPTRHALSTHLLDGEFNRVQAKVKQTIDKADCISVISYGWSNVWGQGIINYSVTTPHPVLYKSTDTKDHRHTGPTLPMKVVINDLGPQKVFALVTDDAANMKVAWAHVEETFPHITTIGCASHALNLLLKDIMALNTMDTLYKIAKQVVKDVKGKQMAISQGAAIESAIKRILLDKVSLRILKPIAAAIAKIEGDNTILSDVKCAFAELKEEIQTVLPTSLLLQAEKTAVVKSMEKHQEFCVKPIHAAAYMLDPKYEKSIISVEEISSAYAVITAITVPSKAFGNGMGYGSHASTYLHLPGEKDFVDLRPWHLWSLFGNIYAKVCNRLTNTRVEKLVAIRANLQLFDPDIEPSSTRLDSGTEGEDESDVEEADLENVDEILEEAIET
ncbi:hypothetical protein M9458_050817 [Cirrhinus mrigala]|uniref:DUF659 domain-containing protein n=1 Tax=Cirrhinus mrigala TaxID=683832 RepID=A0ABD0MY41_CIRMR